MKSNYICNRSELKKVSDQIAKKLISSIDEDAYHHAAKDIAEQLTAVHLYVLATTFGFGEKRLKRFIDSANSLNAMMMSDGAFLGRRADPDDVRAYIENKYNLDISLKELVSEKKEKKRK